LKSNIKLFGDSFVFGQGVTEQETISSYLRDSCDANVFNYGVCAISNDCISRIVLNYAKSGDFCFVFLTYPSRLEYLTKTDCFAIFEKSQRLHQVFKDYYLFLENDYNSTYNMLRSMILVKYYLLNINCKFYFIDILDIFNIKCILSNTVLKNLFNHISTDIMILPKSKIVSDYALDNIHYGKVTNLNISNYLNNKYMEDSK
jgi:hypothetical protein